MFWFLVSIVAIILWLQERSKSKRSSWREYARGREDERRAIRDRVREVAYRDGASVSDVLAVFETTKVDVPVPIPTPENAADSGLESDVPDFSQELSAKPEGSTITAQQTEFDKERRTINNLNTLLYVGSFMIVAAAALFVNLTMPAIVKLIALTLVTLGFYIAGLVLYARSTKLRPAAIAFVGTGLAILPFVGFLLPSLVGWSDEAAWFATSAVGLLAYGVAAARLNSQLVSYITMAFVISLALSAVSTLGLGVIWYFITLIALSVVINSIAYLAPGVLPDVFRRPLKDTGRVVTPLTLLASLFIYNQMDLFMYEVLFAVASLHYLVIWLQTRNIVYELAVRGLSHVTAIVFSYDISQQIDGDAGKIIFGSLWFILAAIQVGYSCWRVERDNAKSVKRESPIILIMLGVMLYGLTIWLFTSDPALWSAIHLSAMAALYIGVSIRFRQAEWAYVSLAASVLVPYIFIRHVLDPAMPVWVLALVFAVFGTIALAVLDDIKERGRSNSLSLLLSTAVATYTAGVFISGMASDDTVTIAWTSAVAAGLMVLFSYVIKAVAAEVIGAILVTISISAWTSYAIDDMAWQWVSAVVLSAVVMFIGAVIHHTQNENSRRDALAVIGVVVFCGLVLLSFSGNIIALRTATLLLVGVSIGMMSLRILYGAKTSLVSNLAMVAYLLYPILALFTAISLGAGWSTFVTLFIAGVLWLGSYIERKPGILAVGNVLFVIGLFALWSWLSLSGEEWQLYGVAWLSSSVFYLMYWFNRDRLDTKRQMISLVSVVLVLAIATIAGLFDSDIRWVSASAGSLIVASLIVALHGYLEKKREYIEGAVYAATFGLQRIVAVIMPEVNMVVYGHWWALVVGLVAFWRKDVSIRLGVALAFVTASTGLHALSGATGYQLLFLIEHVIVAVVGALARKQWVMWWGIVSVIIAILYFLRNYTVAALMFIGILLIIFVIWRLTKGEKDQSKQ